MQELENISPIDGRYREKVAVLSRFFSESALIRYRTIVEGEYLLALSENPHIALRRFSTREKHFIRSLYQMPLKDALAVKKIETITRHDVKAVEYFLKKKLGKTSLKDCTEWIHFALTSEDTNNLAYALMLSESIQQVLTPTLETLSANIGKFALTYKDLPMLARTHGQPASPTTLGKEFKVCQARLERQIFQLKNYRILAKLNGATGNYNAHFAAYPKVDWVAFTKRFIDRLGKMRAVKLDVNAITTQIEPHDTYAEIFDIIRRINVILIDFNQDIWRYISDGWIKQKISPQEIGSSTMPHKVNPIHFENSEGNLGLANAWLAHFSNKLPISRLQRDLSDSTVERNFGVVLSHCLLAYRSTLDGLAKIDVDKETILSALESHPEVLGEFIQTIFRREGLPFPYEKIKHLTRGKQVSKNALNEYIDTLPIKRTLKKYLKGISPEKYFGIADQLAAIK